ncbi:MAG TPA: hypothetical protein VIK97_06045 [Casimicrobiaceae bacterium]
MSRLILALALGHLACTLAIVVGGGASFLRRRRYLQQAEAQANAQANA